MYRVTASKDSSHQYIVFPEIIHMITFMLKLMSSRIHYYVQIIVSKFWDHHHYAILAISDYFDKHLIVVLFLDIQMQIEEAIPSRYENFKLWIKRNGCKLDSRVQISPEGSCMGLSTTSQIPPNTVIMAVPQKLILTVEKCYYGQLRKLFESDDDLFDYEGSDDAEFNVLAVFIMHEKAKIIKGRREHPEQEFFSFWQPYIDSVEQGETGMDWSEEELDGLYNEFREEVAHFKKEIDVMEKRVAKFLMGREEFAGLTEEELKELFNYGYKFIMTRCFGYCTPGTSLIPLADLMNHGCEAVDHQLINTNRQQRPPSEEYTKYSHRVDMSLLQIKGVNPPESQTEPVTTYLVEQVGMAKQNAEKLKRAERRKLVLEINSKQPEKMLDLNYFSSSDDEDNDTESQDEEMREQEMEFLKEQERQQMNLFRHMPNSIKLVSYEAAESKLDELEKKENQHVKQAQKAQEICREHIQKSQQLLKNAQSQSKQTEVIHQNKSQAQAMDTSPVPNQQKTESRQQNLIQKAIQQKFSQQNKFKKLSQKLQKLGALKFMDEKIDSSSSEEESEEQFKWFKEPGTYFLITTHRPVDAGQPLYNCYGRRTNKFLIIWYGFCYPNNLFDSVCFRFYVNFSLQNDVGKLIFDHYYGGKGLIRGFSRDGGITIQSNEVSKEFRLKRSRIYENLLIFLRLFLMNQYKGADIKKLFVIFPASFEFEIFVLSFMEKLVSEVAKRYPEELIRKWRTSENYRIRFKATFYEQQRKIISQQIKMIALARQILIKLMSDPQSKVTQILREQKDYETVRKIRKYLKSVEDNINYIRLPCAGI